MHIVLNYSHVFNCSELLSCSAMLKTFRETGVTLLYSRKLTEHCKSAMMEKIKIIKKIKIGPIRQCKKKKTKKTKKETNHSESCPQEHFICGHLPISIQPLSEGYDFGEIIVRRM